MNTNPMICDLKTGVCGVSDDEPTQIIDFNPQPQPKVTLYYATDPICSHCWAIEPTLNRFIQQYGKYFHLQPLMGGLLAGWNGFADKANGIQQPSDVAGHWKEVGEHYRMPIDGTLWLNNPIMSSYPPSRVFKVIQQRHPGKELAYLRSAREAVFVFNRNIGEDEVLADIVDSLGLPGDEIVEAAGLEAAQELLEADFQKGGPARRTRLPDPCHGQ
ncbi:DsbA family protein [Paenibacillus rhizoplanae]